MNEFRSETELHDFLRLLVEREEDLDDLFEHSDFEYIDKLDEFPNSYYLYEPALNKIIKIDGDKGTTYSSNVIFFLKHVLPGDEL